MGLTFLAQTANIRCDFFKAMNITRKADRIILQEKAAQVTIEADKQVVIKSAEPTTIDWPGEYEVKGITVRAFQEGDGLSMLVSFESIRFFVPARTPLGSIENDLEELGGSDVLFVFAESSDWTSKEWKKFIEEVEPRIVVFCEDGEKSDKLRKEIGAEQLERLDKIELQTKTLPTETIRFLLLTEG